MKRIMNVIAACLLLSLFFFSSSCTKEEVSGSQQLLGTWRVYEVLLRGEVVDPDLGYEEDWIFREDKVIIRDYLDEDDHTDYDEEVFSYVAEDGNLQIAGVYSLEYSFSGKKSLFLYNPIADTTIKLRKRSNSTR